MVRYTRFWVKYNSKIWVSGTTRAADSYRVKELLLEGSNRYFDQTPCVGYTVTKEGITKLCHDLKETASKNTRNETATQAPQATRGTTQATQTTTKATQSTTQTIKLATRDKQVLRIIAAQPSITQLKLALEIGWPVDRVKYYIKKLRGKGILRRNGTSQKGTWKIIIGEDIWQN